MKTVFSILKSAIILIVTVWFATFSESFSESQARAKVDSLKNLEKEVLAKKLVDGKEVSVRSTSLKVGDRVQSLCWRDNSKRWYCA